jgi:hypothetical protein
VNTVKDDHHLSNVARADRAQATVNAASVRALRSMESQLFGASREGAIEGVVAGLT